MKRLLLITQKVDSDDQLLGFFVPWIQRLAHRTGQITILCLQQGAYDLPPNVQVINLGKDKGYSKLRQLMNFYGYLFRFRDRYDAVLVHMNPIWAVLGGLPWRLMGKRVLLWYTHKAVTLKLRLAERLVHTILTASPESFRLRSSKIVVTGHGINTELFKPDPTKRLPGRHILSVGRIAPVKNYETLIEAAAILRSEQIDFHVTLIGEPALAQDWIYIQKIRRMIENRRLTDNFRFVGKVINRDLVPYYQSHALFVHVSRTGSLDKAILEAMSCGEVVISCNDASRAFLSPSLIFQEDDADALAKAIRRISLEPALDLRRYVVDHHNLEKLIETISSLL